MQTDSISLLKMHTARNCGTVCKPGAGTVEAEITKTTCWHHLLFIGLVVTGVHCQPVQVEFSTYVLKSLLITFKMEVWGSNF